jgi:hypothetical protein
MIFVNLMSDLGRARSFYEGTVGDRPGRPRVQISYLEPVHVID